MNERSVKHSTFVIERNYEALPARVFVAWADPLDKAQWFPKADEFDFQVGGGKLGDIMTTRNWNTTLTNILNIMEMKQLYAVYNVYTL